MRRYLPLAVFVAAYMLLAAALSLGERNSEFVFYGLVMLVLIACVLWVDRTVKLPTWLLWGLAMWGLMHMMGGTVRVPEAWVDRGMTTHVLYNVRPVPWLPRYDQWTHAYGFFIAALVAWRAVLAASRNSLRPSFGVLFAVVCLGMGLGALNEVVEFAATRFMDTNVGDYVNTGWDLVSNLVGAVIAAVVVRFQPTPHRERQPPVAI
ncbi:MAG: DUF2238 domain-containing protein [Phycisphaerales bacterium]|nr:DUF2238 domain-containing protein [Phycisphaerales bacterium]